MLISFRRIYEEDVQNASRHVLSHLSIHGIQSSSYSDGSITSAEICRFSRQKLKSVIGQELLICLLHKEFRLPNPLLHKWPFNSWLTGINKSKSLTPNQKQPLTSSMLLQLHALLDLNSSLEASFRATCLVAFYGMFCKPHLLTAAANHFNPTKQLTKADFKIFTWGTLVSVRWSKTIQFRERLVEIPHLVPRQPILVAFDSLRLCQLEVRKPSIG